MGVERPRGVSQVIGLVLLVAIVTVLAGVVALSVTGFGQQIREPAPAFAHGTTYNQSLAGNGQYLNITFQSGQTVETSNLYLDVNDAMVFDATTGTTVGAAVDKDGVLASQLGDEFAASDTLVVSRSSFEKAGGVAFTSSEYVDLSDATVRIVFAPENSQRSDVIYVCEVEFPDCSSSQD